MGAMDAISKNTRNTLITGNVVSVRGSVVDVHFSQNLPPIYTLLRAGKEDQIAIEVLSQLDSTCVRGIALTPTQGLARGMTVKNTGGTIMTPIGKGIFSRMFDVFGNTIDRQGDLSNIQWNSIHQDPPPLGRRSTKSEIFETGIKHLQHQVVCVIVVVAVFVGSVQQALTQDP